MTDLRRNYLLGEIGRCRDLALECLESIKDAAAELADTPTPPQSLDELVRRVRLADAVLAEVIPAALWDAVNAAVGARDAVLVERMRQNRAMVLAALNEDNPKDTGQ